MALPLLEQTYVGLCINRTTVSVVNTALSWDRLCNVLIALHYLASDGVLYTNKSCRYNRSQRQLTMTCLDYLLTLKQLSIILLYSYHTLCTGMTSEHHCCCFPDTIAVIESILLFLQLAKQHTTATTYNRLVQNYIVHTVKKISHSPQNFLQYFHWGATCGSGSTLLFSPLSIYFIFCFFTFPFLHWLYLFSSFVHPFPLYQNSPTPFPGRRS